MRRWRCTECGTTHDEGALLEAPNPFADTAAIIGCPHCKAVECFEEVCDEPGCKENASCGWPSKAGPYRRTCYDHSSFKHPELKGE